uniref:RING-type domain-containing protein n=1 Tax=Globodera rostochiensis TaxID=31243 RepID=A0A914H4T1_GLORO
MSICLGAANKQEALDALVNYVSVKIKQHDIQVLQTMMLKKSANQNANLLNDNFEHQNQNANLGRSNSNHDHSNPVDQQNPIANNAVVEHSNARSIFNQHLNLGTINVHPNNPTNYGEENQNPNSNHRTVNIQAPRHSALRRRSTVNERDEQSSILRPRNVEQHLNNSDAEELINQYLNNGMEHLITTYSRLTPEAISTINVHQNLNTNQQDVSSVDGGGHSHADAHSNRNANDVVEPETDETPKCPICLDELTPSTDVKELQSCRHTFHRECVDTWLVQKQTCPSCRSEVNIRDLNGVDLAPEVPNGHFVLGVAGREVRGAHRVVFTGSMLEFGLSPGNSIAHRECSHTIFLDPCIDEQCNDKNNKLSAPIGNK